MLRAITAYNALTGSEMSEIDGWVFMCVLKMARATAGKPHLDDFTDLAGYSALAAEAVIGVKCARSDVKVTGAPRHEQEQE